VAPLRSRALRGLLLTAVPRSGWSAENLERSAQVAVCPACHPDIPLRQLRPSQPTGRLTLQLDVVALLSESRLETAISSVSSSIVDTALMASRETNRTLIDTVLTHSGGHDIQWDLTGRDPPVLATETAGWVLGHAWPGNDEAAHRRRCRHPQRQPPRRCGAD
jgi:hypothetical protein